MTIVVLIYDTVYSLCCRVHTKAQNNKMNYINNCVSPSHMVT